MPTSNISQQPQKASNFSCCLGAHKSRGLLSQPWENPSPNWCLWQFKSPPMHAQLAILSILGHSATHGVDWLFGHIYSPKTQILPSGNILLHWPFWPISNLTNPQANTAKFVPGGNQVF
ncbi:hypothetical protein O181_019117 [Austropuccinia psidii MF-1]|uniref:Uncharacterized protein n=1 Tax=Austropuccinia psidii MF-1 TaxID=1389203 RepID=A0A9Q3CAW7_9BASI|nr:hypothetical protein [Austropuccinia psidii MF-1]